MSDLPLELIVDILRREPVKSLLRFRCVSKAWCVLIDNPYFIKTHLNRSIESNNNLTLIIGEMDPYQNNKTLYSLDFYSLHTPPIPFDNPFKNYEVLGSCNGLLLLKGRGSDHQLVLLNLSTKQHRNLPANTMEYPDGSLIVDKCGLGYDSFNNDYKVIRILEFYEPRKGVQIVAMVYRLKSNLVLKIGDFPYFLLPGCIYGWGPQINGALHIVVKDSYNISLSSMIVGFDIAEEKFYLVPKPDFLDKVDVEMSVDVLGGCLCLVCSYKDYTDVWVMKFYGVKESWTKLLSISSPEFKYYVSLRPLGYSKSRDEVLFCIDEQKLIWYDLKMMEIKNVEVPGLPKTIYVEVCVGSLVPLDGYGASGELTKQNKEEKKEEG